MPPYFELKLEVYSYLLTEPVTSAHAKLVRTINKAVGSIQKVLKEHNEEVDNLSFNIFIKKKNFVLFFYWVYVYFPVIIIRNLLSCFMCP